MVKMFSLGTGEMVQWLRALLLLAEYLNLVHITHVVAYTISKFQGFGKEMVQQIKSTGFSYKTYV